MKVLHAVTLHTPDHAFGGPMRVALNLSGGLRARGVDARIVALGDGFDADLPAQIEGVPAHLFRARHVLPRFEVSGITSGALLRRASALVAEADVVHVHLMRDLVTLPIAVAAVRSGRPLVVQTHGMVDPSDKLLARLLDVVAVRRVLRSANVLTYLTDLEREHLRAVVAPSQLSTMARLVNGVPAGPLRPVVPRRPVVLYLARMQARKRPEEFVRTMPAVLRVLPATRFVLAGPDSGALAGALALAEKLGVRGSLDHVGPLGHAAALEHLCAASVSVLPSLDEPFPMSILEALSVGVPVVITGSNGLAADVAESGAGRVAYDDSELAPAIIELLDAETNRKAGAAAWNLARSTFSIDAVLDTLQGLYRRALAG